MTQTTLYATNNYAAFSHRGGGISLRHLNSGWECFFQPGDDAETFRASIEALDEVNEDRRDDIFDMIASNYHA
ncbi:hypothetical protein [EBPR siphovirus 5]|nr:hypothetical protein [EBPR siphovirus 5]